MTQDQFLIDLYGIVADIANGVASFLTGQGILGDIDTILEAISFALFAADVALFWVRFGVCTASDFV